MVNKAEKTYRQELDDLLKKERHWKRKSTIARHKLETVRDAINDLALDVVKPWRIKTIK